MPKKSPGPAQREVALGDHEAVRRLDERVEARPRRVADRASGTAARTSTRARRVRRGRAAGGAARGRTARRARRSSPSRSARRRRPRRPSSTRARARRRARTPPSRDPSRPASAGRAAAPTRVLGKHLRLQVVGHRRRRAQVDLLGVLDERIDHVDLPAALELAPREPVDLVAPRLRLARSSGSAAGPAAGRESRTRRGRRTPSAPASAESASRS